MPYRRKGSEADVRKKIKAIDLSCVAWRLYVKKNVEGFRWTMPFIKKIENAYRGFLFVCWKYPHEKNVPSTAMDAFWHTHILYTDKYAKDCNDIFGYFLIHNPNFGMPQMSERFKQGYYDKHKRKS